MQAKSCANRDAARPYWKPRAKGFHPFGYPHHFLTNGTHIEKTAFYHVGPFLENATAHDIHFAEVGAGQLRATITAFGQTVSGVFTFNDKAEMIRFTTNDRSLSNDDGSTTKTPWVATCGDYQHAENGCLQPTTFKATWQLPDGDFTYFDGKIKAITYNE